MTFNYVGPINTTGYGVASSNYLSELLKLDSTIGFKPIGQIQVASPLTAEILDSAAKNFDPSKPTFCFWHLFDIPNQIKECTGRKIGMTTFEVDTLKQQEVEAIASLDAICTASTWGRDVLKQHRAKKVHVIPHAFKETDSTSLPVHNRELDPRPVWENALAPLKIDEDTLILSTAGKYEVRKSHPELIDACIEIGKEKPILLISFLFNPFIHDNFPYSFINSRFMYPVHTKSGIKVFRKGKFHLVLMPPTSKRSELHSALSKADFFVSPSKGEGWNLPLFEMMSYGMPCITTRNTAHKDFCDINNCVTVKSDPDQLFVSAFDGQFFNGSAKWHNITKKGIYNAINEAHQLKGPAELDVMSQKAIQSTSKFSWQKSAQMIVNLMNQN